MIKNDFNFLPFMNFLLLKK
ncbi:hypothetical protein, partial [Plasmodium yoelii yoelii]